MPGTPEDLLRNEIKEYPIILRRYKKHYKYLSENKTNKDEIVSYCFDELEKLITKDRYDNGTIPKPYITQEAKIIVLLLSDFGLLNKDVNTTIKNIENELELKNTPNT